MFERPALEALEQFSHPHASFAKAGIVGVPLSTHLLDDEFGIAADVDLVEPEVAGGFQRADERLVLGAVVRRLADFVPAVGDDAVGRDDHPADGRGPRVAAAGPVEVDVCPAATRLEEQREFARIGSLHHDFVVVGDRDGVAAFGPPPFVWRVARLDGDARAFETVGCGRRVARDRRHTARFDLDTKSYVALASSTSFSRRRRRSCCGYARDQHNTEAGCDPSGARMELSAFIDHETNERAERRRLAAEKSYEILDRLEGVEQHFADLDTDTAVGSVSPSIFVGRAGYPQVSTGLLSPVGHEERAASFVTSAGWYDEGVSIADVFERRSSLLNATQTTPVETGVHDVWEGFLGVQREIALSDRPVGIEVGLDGSPTLELGLSESDVAAPSGPRARATDAALTENPHVPRPIKKTLEDDDWAATGAMNYLYNRGFDVYEINTILSAGALGRREDRRLVPTRWSITAVDDTIGQYLRGTLADAPSVDSVSVYHTEYLGNRFWVVLAPGNWEFELLECKAPGSVWNPDPASGVHLASDYEGPAGRTGYVEETAGAYYAARLAVLEFLESIGRQATVLVLRHVSDDYWGPVGVWQVRESIRHAFEGARGESESVEDALKIITDQLPISPATLRRASTIAAGRQSELDAFG